MTLEITLLQVCRSQEKTMALFCAVLRDFAAWAMLRPLSGLAPSEPDRPGALRLDHLFFGSYLAVDSEKLRAARTTGAFWVHDDAKFTKTFNDTILQLRLPTATVAYQLRHGAAPRAAQRETGSLAGIQRRLRHGGPVLTQRYEKPTRRLGEQRVLTPEPRGQNPWGGCRRGALLLGTSSPIAFKEFCSARRRAHRRALSTSSGPPAKQLLTVGRRSS
jgi:hypothetical protein